MCVNCARKYVVSGGIYTTGKDFTLLSVGTNLTSALQSTFTRIRSIVPSAMLIYIDDIWGSSLFLNVRSSFRLWVVTLAAFVWHIFVTLTPLISSISPTKGEEDALSKERKVSPNRPGLAQMVTFTKSQSLYLSASKHSYLPENFLTRSYTSKVSTIPHFTLCCIVCLIFYSSEDEGSVTGQICVFVNFQDSARVAQKYMLSFGFNLYSFVKETVGEDKRFVFIYFWEIRS